MHGDHQNVGLSQTVDCVSDCAPQYFTRNLQSLLSRVPAPPKAYIHFDSGIPISRAYSVEVKITAPARLIVLKAFISSGSAQVSTYPTT